MTEQRATWCHIHVGAWLRHHLSSRCSYLSTTWHKYSSSTPVHPAPRHTTCQYSRGASPHTSRPFQILYFIPGVRFSPLIMTDVAFMGLFPWFCRSVRPAGSPVCVLSFSGNHVSSNSLSGARSHQRMPRTYGITHVVLYLTTRARRTAGTRPHRRHPSRRWICSH